MSFPQWSCFQIHLLLFALAHPKIVSAWFLVPISVLIYIKEMYSLRLWRSYGSKGIPLALTDRDANFHEHLSKHLIYGNAFSDKSLGLLKCYLMVSRQIWRELENEVLLNGEYCAECKNHPFCIRHSILHKEILSVLMYHHLCLRWHSKNMFKIFFHRFLLHHTSQFFTQASTTNNLVQNFKKKCIFWVSKIRGTQPSKRRPLSMKKVTCLLFFPIPSYWLL